MSAFRPPLSQDERIGVALRLDSGTLVRLD